MLRVLFIISFIHFFSSFSLGQNTGKVSNERDLRLVFYNCENLFDVQDDPQKNDAEFLPDGKQKWDLKKYTHKLDQMSRVLSAIDTLNFPAIIGLCEVENKLVLEDLIKHPNLKEGNYSIIHKNSPDFRGIDNAIIYRSDLYIPMLCPDHPFL